MPDIKRLGTLIDRLAKLSNDNQVPWVETADERTFQAALKGYAVAIAQEDAGDYYGEPTYQYSIRFYDASGKLLDTATESDFPNAFTFGGGKVQGSPTGPL